jgi:4-amino-4-deoxy-L-arabinose transferase-like glycosyltransferase
MKKYIWLACIVVFAAVIRFWNLTGVPPALNSDEVAIGYNAYSILKTGKDEYGAQTPLTFRSFDDYKMPVYVYLVAGSMRIFEDRDFAVRFPSALVGTLTVLFTFFLVKELFKKSRDSYGIALVSAFLVTISPWHIHFSRSGYMKQMWRLGS